MSLRNSAALLLLCAAADVAADATLAIKLDQVGYLPTSPQTALLAAPAAPPQVNVRSADFHIPGIGRSWEAEPWPGLLCGGRNQP